MLAVSLPSPPYEAVSECAATESVEVISVAVPPLRVPVPIVAAPSLKVIVPVAVDGNTLAVKVTFVPNVEGFSDDIKFVVVET